MKWKVWMLCGVFAVFSLANVLAPERVFSEAENRYLETKPKLETKAVLDGSYMENFETWMSDQLLFRDDLVSIKATADQVTGKGDSGGVYIGSDGYLLEMFTEVDETLLEENVGAAAVFLEGLEEKGIRGHFLMVPTAASVLEEKLPVFAPELDQEAMMEAMAEEIPGFLSVTDALKRGAAENAQAGVQKENGMSRIFYRTDHHWTSLGAYYAYAAFCEATGREAPPLSEYEFPVLSTEFYGTSYAKAGLYQLEPDVMTAAQRKVYTKVTVEYSDGTVSNSLYDHTFLEKRDKYRVYLRGNYPLTKISSEKKNGEKLLLIKDSYANTFVQFLTEDFEEIHVVDLRYFKADLETYMQEQGITEVLLLYQIKNFAEDTGLRFALQSR